MPSKESGTKENCEAAILQPTNVVIAAATHHNNNGGAGGFVTKDLIPRDVDELVNEIKLNLRLRGASGGSGGTPCTSNATILSPVSQFGSAAADVLRNAACSASTKAAVASFRCAAANVVGSGGGGGPPGILRICSGANNRTKLRSSSNSRLAPYFVPPPRSEGDSGCHSCGSPRCLRTCHRQPRTDSSDPYELLQELLKEGGLIKEAVRRINKTEALKCYDYEKDEYESKATPSNNLIGLEA